ncbi:hypothetical protein HDF09_004025 [Edaphobacter lichenicola]|uniref:Uncharacterized protein n=1 Tax=Tunturiibacter empetritectus TaxID=3069691 RepID=A0A7W8MUI1_9BACT|nr:hypothetical protein [Edaphobacter lichenicola]
MRTNKVIFYCLLDFGHMAGNALTPGASFSMVSVLAHRPFEPGRIFLRVAGQADRIADRNEVRGVLITVYLMAVETADLPVIHLALDEVVALHPVFVRGQVGKLIEVGVFQASVLRASSNRLAFGMAKSQRASRNTCPRLGC